MLGIKLAGLLALGATSYALSIQHFGKADALVAKRHFEPSLVERCDTCDSTGGGGGPIKVDVGLGLGGTIQTGVNVDIVAEINAALTAAVGSCAAHVVTIKSACLAGGANVGTIVQAELQAILSIVAALKAKLEVLVQTGKTCAATVITAELTLLLQVFASIFISISTCASVTVILQVCAQVLGDLEAEIVAVIQLLAKLCTGDLVGLVASICLSLGLTGAVCGKLGLKVFASAILKIAGAVVAKSASAPVDLQAQFSAAIKAAVDACESSVVAIVAKAKAGGDVAAAIQAELVIILGVFVKLQAQLAACISTGLHVDASVFVDEITALVSVIARVCLAIYASASVSIIVQVCVGVLAQLDAAIVAVVKVLASLNGGLALFLSLCGKAGLTADICTKLNLKACVGLGLQAGAGAAVDLVAQVHALLQATISSCGPHVTAIVGLCKGDINAIVIAKVIAEIQAVVALCVSVRVQLLACVAAGFKASASEFQAEIQAILSIFAQIVLAVKANAALLSACGAVLIQLDVCITALIQVWISCLSGVVALCLQICASVGITSDLLTQLNLTGLLHLIF